MHAIAQLRKTTSTIIKLISCALYNCKAVNPTNKHINIGFAQLEWKLWRKTNPHETKPIKV